MHILKRRRYGGEVLTVFAALLSLFLPLEAFGQSMASLSGSVNDPSGALIAGAEITLVQGKIIAQTYSDGHGRYSATNLASGAYRLTAQAPNLAYTSATSIMISAGQARHLNLVLVPTQQQSIQVLGDNPKVSLEPDENASAQVLKGAALDALSDDPDQFTNELQTLAGSSPGPNRGQLYINGFSGGQIPPKSTIKEIRINQNPYSAEFDQMGYGRIEVITKPCSDTLTGLLSVVGDDSSFNTANPLAANQPDYYSYFFRFDVSGPITGEMSYFFHLFNRRRQNQNIVVAIDPTNTGVTLTATVPNPTNLFYLDPRVCVRFGANNMLSVQDDFTRETQNTNGAGGLDLPSQANNLNDQENALQLIHTQVISTRLLNELRFRWRRIRNAQYATSFTPTVTVPGAFTTGGSNAGVVEDHQDIFELQNYTTSASKGHTIRFGARLRAYRDANFSTSGENGQYVFQSISQYVAKTPALYQATLVHQPVARAILFDAALFYEDELHWKPNLTVSYGLRYEGQNHIHNHADWAPRFQISWAPALYHAPSTNPRTIIRLGYGWFYDRFLVPDSLSSPTGTPYIMQAIHQNGINQQSYLVNNPGFYDPAAPVSAAALQANSMPGYDTIDPHFHAALDMQSSLTVDQRLGKAGILSMTYLYTQGVHQYLTNNIAAPAFNPATYTVTGPPTNGFNNQFQAGGAFKEHQVVLTHQLQYRKNSVQFSYTYSHAMSDTAGPAYFPSVASNPGLDYGRAAFGISHQLVLMGNYSAPHGITVSPFLAAQSGTPYNFTIGDDLTQNNQFNARPAYGPCGASGVIVTHYGCLDTAPIGKGERIVPFDLGTGPANFVFNLHAGNSIELGPKEKSGVSALADAARRYQLTFNVSAINLFNIANLGPPNGVVSSSLFGKSQSLATGAFASPTPGNRSVFLQTLFTF